MFDEYPFLKSYFQFSTQVDDKQRISFGLRLNQSLNENDEIEIKIGVKLFSSSTEIQTLTRNETKEGILVLSLLNRGHKLLLSLMLPQDHQNSEDNKIILSEWNSSELKKHGENTSLMNIPYFQNE